MRHARRIRIHGTTATPMALQLPYSASASPLSLLFCAAWVSLSAHAAEPAALVLQPQQVASLGVRSEALAAQPGRTAVTYPARVVVPPAQQRVVSAPLGGLVEALGVAAGDAVRAGQVLARLRSPQAQELQRDVLQTASQYDLAQRALARDEQLHAEGLISTARLEATRAARQQAGLQFNERQRMLAHSGASALASAPGADAGGGAAAPPNASFGAGAGEVALRSPIAGVVLEALVAVGQRVEPATALFRVADLSTLWLELQVPAADVGTLRAGDAVQYAEGRAPARVLTIAQAVEPATQTVMVRAELKAQKAPAAGRAAPALRPGQVLEVRIEHSGPGLVQVPAAAVVQGNGGGSAVFVEQAPGRYRLVPVTVRASAGGTSAVSGLDAGNRVVVSGTAALLALARP
jgi:multidrug efflux pump subunit AcrA (membrane-fusion protein)